VTSSHVTAGWIGGSPLHEAKVISGEVEGGGEVRGRCEEDHDRRFDMACRPAVTGHYDSKWCIVYYNP